MRFLCHWFVAGALFIGMQGCAKRQAYPEGRDDFAGTFYDKRNIEEVMAAIDSLRTSALDRTYPTMAALLAAAANLPKVRTSAGVCMTYSIVAQGSGYDHHLALSGNEYLATVYARNLVALFCRRTGLPVPKSICKTTRDIYHADWMLSSVDHASFRERKRPAHLSWEESLQALVGEISIEIKHVDSPLP